jgi:hypothetical protein
MIERLLAACQFTTRARSQRLELSRPVWMFAAATCALAAGVGCSGPDKDKDTESDVETLEPGDNGPMEMPTATATSTANTPPAVVPRGDTPNGLSLPDDVLDWRVIGVVERPGDEQIRVIVGNDIAVDAARTGDTRPWPDGSMIADLVWAVGENDTQPDNVVPGNFAALAMMVKDSEKYAADGGWAYGVWATPSLNPPAAADFDRACVNCHVDNASGTDFVFTAPGVLPTRGGIRSSQPSPNNGIIIPPAMLDWRVLGVVNPANPAMGTPTIRVIVGNDVAIEAARSGDTDPWPEDTAIGHFVWAEAEAPESFVAAGVEGATVPGAFAAITLMTKNSTRFEADGGWAYSNWATGVLNPPASGSDQACVDCHTSNVSSRDFVFTDPAAFPDL